MKLEEKWRVENIRELDSEDIQKDVQQYQSTVNKLKINRSTMGK